jgi:hypothetical protein
VARKKRSDAEVYAMTHTVQVTDATCMRCGHEGMAIVPNIDPDTGFLRGVGLGQHARLCGNACKGEWLPCPKCEGHRTSRHIKECEVENPGYRARWEEGRATFGGQMFVLATKIAMKGEFPPEFMMRMLFDPDQNVGIDLGMGSELETASDRKRKAKIMRDRELAVEVTDDVRRMPKGASK